MISTEHVKKRAWYHNYLFPILPHFEYVKGDDHNTYSACISWLFFKFWTLDSFEFEFSFVVSSHWGVGVIGIVPYLRFTACIPFTESMTLWIQRKLWRRAKGDKSFQ